MTVLSLTLFKVCSLCGCTKPAAPDYFTKDKGKRDGFSSRCRACHKLYAKDHYWRNRDRNRAACRRWYLDNTEKHREVGRVWAEKNRAALADYKRRWRQENGERLAAYHRRYYQDNKATIKKRVARWQAENRDRVNTHGRKSKAKRRAADREPYTTEDVAGLWIVQGGVCAYCPAPLLSDYHIDHRNPLSRGGADRLENLALACPFCNRSKGAKTPDEFVAYRSEFA